MSKDFYKAFEKKHRGSFELISSRLLVYLPFILPLLRAYPKGRAVDLGCGRGEWLQLLCEYGFDPIGVDIDEGIVQICRERGLNAKTADALAYLKDMPQGSVCIVSGFHLAEHLNFEVLQQLVIEAKRVLMPGGLLILETPNPENISVGSNSFYVDPTHLRPLPQELLSFIPEYFGYERLKVLRLQENTLLHSQKNISLLQVLNGVSPDYAVVAQTAGYPRVMDELNQAFEQEYGLTLNSLTEKYDSIIEERLHLVELSVLQAQKQLQQAQGQ